MQNFSEKFKTLIVTIIFIVICNFITSMPVGSLYDLANIIVYVLVAGFSFIIYALWKIIDILNK